MSGRAPYLNSRLQVYTSTVTISSATKTFSVTGWKLGWACARLELIAAIRTAKQFLSFVNAAPFQYAVSEGLTESHDYLVEAGERAPTKA